MNTLSCLAASSSLAITRLLTYVTCGCSAASNWQPGPYAVSTIVKCLQGDFSKETGGSTYSVLQNY